MSWVATASLSTVESSARRRPHRSLPHRATPATVYQARPKANPGTRTDSGLGGTAQIHLLKRIQPQTAAAAIADRLERRRSSVTVPGRWRPVAALRGVAGPMVDARLARDAAVRRALAQLENR